MLNYCGIPHWDMGQFPAVINTYYKNGSLMSHIATVGYILCTIIMKYGRIVNNTVTMCELCCFICPLKCSYVDESAILYTSLLLKQLDTLCY